MQIPSGTRPALMGAAAGAVVLAVAGFTYGGWVTGGTAQSMADDAAGNARMQLVAGLCVNKFVAEPDASAQLVKLKETKSWDRDDFIDAGGWSSIAGVDDGVRGVANECARQLAVMEMVPAEATVVPASADNG